VIARVAWLAGLLLIGAVLTLQWNQMLVPSSEHMDISPPELPEPVSEPASDWVALIMKHNLWDKERGAMTGVTDVAGKPAAAPGATVWVLKAVAFSRLAEPEALLLVGKKDAEMKIFHEGDRLPDGARLALIFNDGIEVERGDKLTRIYLFGKSSDVVDMPSGGAE